MTHWSRALAASMVGYDPVSSVTGDLTLVTSDARRFIKLTSGSLQTITVNADSLDEDDYVTLVKTGAGTFDVVAGTGSPVLVNATGGTLTGIPQGGAVSIKATDVPGEFIVVGSGGS